MKAEQVVQSKRQGRGRDSVMAWKKFLRLELLNNAMGNWRANRGMENALQASWDRKNTQKGFHQQITIQCVSLKALWSVIQRKS